MPAGVADDGEKAHLSWTPLRALSFASNLPNKARGPECAGITRIFKICSGKFRAMAVTTATHGRRPEKRPADAHGGDFERQ